MEEPSVTDNDSGGEADFPGGYGSVSSWLSSIGLAQYCELFEEQEIGFDVLEDLTEEDLRELKLPLGSRKRILKAIQQIGEAADSELVNEADIAKPKVVDWAERAESAVVRRQVTIAFCDLVGSTDMADRMDPEDIGDAIASYKAVCKSILDRWNGRIAKFLGDGILVLFGWPTASEDDAERAVHAALELVNSVGNLKANDGTPLSARVGIDTGLVVIGDVGVDGLIERDSVVGKTPNLAARVQGVAKPGMVAIAPSTRELVGERFQLRSDGKHELKGISDPIEIWIVEGVNRFINRFDAKAKEIESPLFGREREIMRLEAVWNEVQAGNGKSLVVHGEAGIGKSRLLKEIADRPEGSCIKLQCLHYLQNNALHPLVEHLSTEIGIVPEDGNAVNLKRLEAFVQTQPSGCEFSQNETVAILSALLSIDSGGGVARSIAELNAAALRNMTFQILIDYFKSRGRNGPSIIVVEDLHWADPTTLELLEELVNQLEDFPVFLLLTARLPVLTGKVEQLELVQLDSDAVLSLVDTLVGERKLPQVFRNSIVRRAQGNPLFVEELARGLVNFSDSEKHESLSVPFGLQDMLLARLDALGDARSIAYVASAIGRPFSVKLLQLLIPEPSGILEQHLINLCEADIFRTYDDAPGELRFGFRHALLGEIAYKTQLKSNRRELHLRIAEVKKDHFPDIAENNPEILGHHFLKAEKFQEGAEFLLQAGRKALFASAIKEAINLFSRGLKAIQSLPRSTPRDRTELRLQALLGTAFMQAKGWASPEVEDAYSAAGELSPAAEDASEEIWVLWGMWVFHQVRGRVFTAQKEVERILARAASSGVEEALLVADMIAFQGNFYAGNFRNSIYSQDVFLNRYDRNAYGHLREEYSTDLELVSYVHYGITSWILGNTKTAFEFAEKTERLIKKIDHGYSTAWGSIWGAVVYLFVGDIDKLSEQVALGRKVARKLNFAYADSMGGIFEGWVEFKNGNPSLAEVKIAGGIEAFCSTGAEIAVPFFTTLRATILISLGKEDLALELLEEAASRITNWGERWQEPEVYRITGRALAAKSPGREFAPAEKSFEKAIEVAREIDSTSFELRAAIEYARYFCSVGNPKSAVELLQPFEKYFERLSPSHDVETARELLGSTG